MKFAKSVRDLDWKLRNFRSFCNVDGVLFFWMQDNYVGIKVFRLWEKNKPFEMKTTNLYRCKLLHNWFVRLFVFFHTKPQFFGEVNHFPRFVFQIVRFLGLNFIQSKQFIQTRNCSLFGNKRAELINLTCLTLVTREVRFF